MIKNNWNMLDWEIRLTNKTYIFYCGISLIEKWELEGLNMTKCTYIILLCSDRA